MDKFCTFPQLFNDMCVCVLGGGGGVYTFTPVYLLVLCAMCD